MKRLLVSLLIFLSALLAGGCSTMYPGYITASDAEVERVNKGEWSEAAAAQIVIIQHPDINGGKLSANAVKKILWLNTQCQKQVPPQLAGLGASAMKGAAMGGVAGAIGTGAGADAAYPNAASVNNYWLFGLIAGGTAGAMNAMATSSYEVGKLTGHCTEKFWAKTLQDDKSGDFSGASVLATGISKASDSRPPAMLW